MKKMTALFFMLFLMSCSSGSSGGSAGMPPTANAAASDAGVFLDPKASFDLFEAFEATKACTLQEFGFDKGSFLELSIMFRQLSDICGTGCGGETGSFVVPNIVFLSKLEPSLWRHEFIHYLLFVNTGNADPNHLHQLFKDQNCINGL